MQNLLSKSLQGVKESKDKGIHDNLILLKVTFSIIVLESLRRITRWVVFAVITFFCKLASANTTLSHQQKNHHLFKTTSGPSRFCCL